MHRQVVPRTEITTGEIFKQILENDREKSAKKKIYKIDTILDRSRVKLIRDKLRNSNHFQGRSFL